MWENSKENCCLQDMDQSIQSVLISLTSFVFLSCTPLVPLWIQLYAQNELYKTVMKVYVDEIILALI